MMANKTIPIIVLNYNSSSDCRKCVSYLKQQQGVDIEIILVDNCSKSDDLTALRSLSTEERCTLLENKENRGYNAGNNIGLRYAAEQGYQYALIANPDMEFPQTDYLHKLLSVMDKNESVVVAGSDIVTPEGIHQNPKDNGNDSWTGCFNWMKFIFHKKNNTATPDWVGNPHQSASCRILNGCCLMLRISFLKDIGFFDENVFLYGEETILGKQVEIIGKQAYYYADTYAIHNHVKSKEGNASFRFKHWKHSRLLYIKKYSGYPFYGKWLSLFSTHLYFFVLGFHEMLLKKK